LVDKSYLLEAFRLCPTAFESFSAPEIVDHIAAEYNYAQGVADGVDKVLKEIKSIREHDKEEA
jgi:hypothetical protein